MSGPGASGTGQWARVSREGAWVAVGQGAAVLAAFVGIAWLTARLSPESYGELALGMTLGTLVNQLLLGPLSNGVARFRSLAAERDGLGPYHVAVRRLVLDAGGLTLAAAFVATAAAWYWLGTRIAALTAAALVFALFLGVSALIGGLLGAARERPAAAVFQGAEAWARVLLGVGAVVVFGNTSVAAMCGYALAGVLMVAIELGYLLPRTATAGAPSDGTGEWRARIVEYSWPFAAWGVFTWAQMVSDRWALQHFGSTRDVGLYSVLYQIGNYPITLAAAMAMQLFAPIVYQRAGDGTDTVRRRAARRLGRQLAAAALAATAVGAAAAWLLADTIFGLLIDARYASVAHLLPWMVVAAGLFASGQALSLNLQSELSSRRMLRAKTVTALVGVAANVVGARAAGVQGVVAAGVAFGLGYLAWITWLEASGDRSGPAATPGEHGAELA